MDSYTFVFLQPRPEPRRQFLSSLAPLTACVGSATHHESFYYLPPGDRTSASVATNIDYHEHNEAPAPDVVAGTPGKLWVCEYITSPEAN